MSKIEAGMLTAVHDCQYWRSGNTEVVPYGPENTSIGVHVYLHRNHIAEVPVGGPVVVNVETLKRWPTSTTVSRLRALGVDARIKGRVPYINGIKV